MSHIEPRTHLVWYAPTARRHYLSKRAACVGEARARIKKKYPSERGDESYPGWSWCDLPRAEVLLKRYARVLFKSLRKTRGAIT
jgi:hypothetical protein